MTKPSGAKRFKVVEGYAIRQDLLQQYERNMTYHLNNGWIIDRTVYDNKHDRFLTTLWAWESNIPEDFDEGKYS